MTLTQPQWVESETPACQVLFRPQLMMTSLVAAQTARSDILYTDIESVHIKVRL